MSSVRGKMPLLALLLTGGWIGSLLGQNSELPPPPNHHVADVAGLLDAATVSILDSELVKFEDVTSNQVLVAIYPDLPGGVDLHRYTTDTFNAWGVGQKEKNNGVVLFVFVHEHQMFITTGRGLETALPNATCQAIITQIMVPLFRQGRFAEGVQAGVNAILKTTKDAYKGTGVE